MVGSAWDFDMEKRNIESIDYQAVEQRIASKAFPFFLPINLLFNKSISVISCFMQSPREMFSF